MRFDEHLETQRYDDFAGTLPVSFTAHPCRDLLTGELHVLCYEATDPKRVRYNVVDAAGRVHQSVLIPVAHGPLIHDCAITSRFVIVMDLPLTLSMRMMMSGRGLPYRWNDKRPARIGLLPHDGEAEDIRWIALEPCFVFHTANAFDLPDGRVALDVIAYDRMFAGDNLAPDEQPRGLERWITDPEAETVAQRVIDPAPQELPTIDDRRTGLPYRYAYALSAVRQLRALLARQGELRASRLGCAASLRDRLRPAVGAGVMGRRKTVESDNTAMGLSGIDHRPITPERFRMLEDKLRRLGFGEEIDNAERRSALTDADTFAMEVAFVIVNSGMRWRVAVPIYAACAEALLAGRSATSVFGHPGKARAIDAVWQRRAELFVEFADSANVLAFCASLPFVGPVTKYHLAEDLGGNFVKPDVHLTRLAAVESTTPWQLCHRLSLAAGYREGMVDTVLWRACEVGLVRSRALPDLGTVSSPTGS